jgi:LmbE family N-acetylglucosaminyl deacetylase
MSHILLAVLLMCGTDTLVCAARMRAIHPPQRILWIGAHPDDESLVAPLLGPACVEGHGACSMIVMTRGAAGGDPTVRSSEMQRAADLFHAHLEQWDFADAMSAVDQTWSAEAGSHETLVNRIVAAIFTENPSVIYTFDPNHGSSCHPAHREVGALVIEALAQIGPAAPNVIFVETLVTYLPNGFAFSSATPDAIAIDARSSWHYLVDDLAIHADQFTAAQIDALRTIPDSQRTVFLAATPAQTSICAAGR